jgi:hypothetical protein
MEMIHYKDASGNLYGFAADGSQDHLKPAGLTAVTNTEAASHGIVSYNKKREEEIAGSDYVRQRLMSYPEMGEFIDAWVKNDQDALEEYRQKCLAVKAKYPKPAGF